MYWEPPDYEEPKGATGERNLFAAVIDTSLKELELILEREARRSPRRLRQWRSTALKQITEKEMALSWIFGDSKDDHSLHFFASAIYDDPSQVIEALRVKAQQILEGRK